jgi:hypothetical protein
MSALESDSKRQKIGHGDHALSSSNNHTVFDDEKKENKLMISLLNGIEEEMTCPM